MSSGARSQKFVSELDDFSPVLQPPLATNSVSLSLTLFSQQQTLTFTALSQWRRSIPLALTSVASPPRPLRWK